MIKRLVIIVGASVTLSATSDISGLPLPRLTWTGLARNGLDYLVNEGCVDASNRRIKRACESLGDNDLESLLDAADIMAGQMRRMRRFLTWLESVFGGLYSEVNHVQCRQTRLHKPPCRSRNTEMGERRFFRAKSWPSAMLDKPTA